MSRGIRVVVLLAAGLTSMTKLEIAQHTAAVSDYFKICHKLDLESSLKIRRSVSLQEETGQVWFD